MHVLAWIFRRKDTRLAFSRSHVAGIMVGERHVEIDRGRPEPVVFRRRIAFAAGKRSSFTPLIPSFAQCSISLIASVMPVVGTCPWAQAGPGAAAM